MNKNIDILKKSGLFSGSQEKDLSELGKSMEPRTVQEGECLAGRGDTATFFFIIKSGTILVAWKRDKSAVLNSPGDFIGLELLSEKGVYVSTLTALTACEIFVIPRETFLAFIQGDSPSAEAFMQAWATHRSGRFPFITGPELPTADYQY